MRRANLAILRVLKVAVTRQLSDVEILIGELLAEVNGYEKSLHLEPIKENIALCVSCFLEIQNSWTGVLVGP